MPKTVRLTVDLKPPLHSIHLFMKGSGNPDEHHEIIGFHGFDKDGKLVYGVGLAPEEADKLDFSDFQISDN